MNDKPIMDMMHTSVHNVTPMQAAIRSADMHLFFLIKTQDFDTAASALSSIILNFIVANIRDDKREEFVLSMGEVVLKAISQVDDALGIPAPVGNA